MDHQNNLQKMAKHFMTKLTSLIFFSVSAKLKSCRDVIHYSYLGGCMSNIDHNTTACNGKVRGL